MSIIEIIILTLIAIIGTNAVAWFMIWKQVKEVREILTKSDIKFVDEDV